MSLRYPQSVWQQGDWIGISEICSWISGIASLFIRFKPMRFFSFGRIYDLIALREIFSIYLFLFFSRLRDKSYNTNTITKTEGERCFAVWQKLPTLNHRRGRHDLSWKSFYNGIACCRSRNMPLPLPALSRCRHVENGILAIVDNAITRVPLAKMVSLSSEYLGPHI